MTTLRKQKKVSIFNIIRNIILVILVFCFILPFWIIIVSSFSDNTLVRANGISLWFQGYSIESYKFLFEFKGNLFLHSIWVSFYTSFISATLSVFICTLAAYALSKKYLPGRRVFNTFFMITLFFSGGTISTYIVIRGIGLYDTVWALILPGIAGATNILLLRNYFYGMPNSLEEAARIDGASDLQVLFKIYMPLALPMMLTIWLMVFVSRWNSWLGSVLYLNAQHESLWTVQYVLRKILSESSALFGTSSGSAADVPAITAKNAGIVMVVLPLVVISPIIQKFYQKGLTAGADKG